MQNISTRKDGSFFTKEQFDLFYPSYGDTYPMYNGAIGMTFEQGGHSAGGLSVITADEDTLSLTDRLEHHFTTGISTIEVSSQQSSRLIREFRKYFTDALAHPSRRVQGLDHQGGGHKGCAGQIDEPQNAVDRNGIAWMQAATGKLFGNRIIKPAGSHRFMRRTRRPRHRRGAAQIEPAAGIVRACLAHQRFGDL